MPSPILPIFLAHAPLLLSSLHSFWKLIYKTNNSQHIAITAMPLTVSLIYSIILSAANDNTPYPNNKYYGDENDYTPVNFFR